MKKSSRFTMPAGLVVVTAAAAAFALLIPSAAAADPVASVVQVSTVSPAVSYTNCGSSSVATNPTTGVSLAAWAANSAVVGSAPLQVALLGVDSAVGAIATYQPDVAHFLGYPGDCDPLAVDAGPSGEFLVTWSDGDTDGAIYGIRVSGAGAFIGGAFAISSNTNYSDIETTSAAWSVADSRYLVTWKSHVATAFPLALDSQQIVGRFIDGAGTPIGSDFLVTDSADGIDNSQDIAFGGGIWVVVGVGRNSGVVQAVSVAASGTVSAQLDVPATAAGPAGPSVDYNASSGQFLIVAKSNTDQWAQLLDGAGALTGAPFTVYTGSGQSRPRVASTGVNGWLVAWHNSGSRDILGIALNTAGAVQGTASTISSGLNNGALERNFRPDVAFSAATGQAYVVWTRNLPTLSETNVVARAWAVAAPLSAAAAPALAATGFDATQMAIVGGSAVMALLAGVVVIATRRRSVRSH
jgi:hypothetical protein